MTHIISIINRKGGVGKTTSALNIANYLSKEGNSTLLIDLDPQGNLSNSIIEKAKSNTIFTLLLEECTLKEVLHEVNPNLYLIPCNEYFARFEKQFAGETDGQYLIKDLIDAISTFPDIPKFEYIIFDCPPALGLISINAMVASNFVVTPIEAQQFSLDGLIQVENEIIKINKRLNPDLKLLGIFFTRHNYQTYLSRDMKDHLSSKYEKQLLKSSIRRNVALEEAPSLKQSIFEYAPDSNGAEDYENLTSELIDRIKINTDK